VWWNSPGLINVNAVTPQILAARGLDLDNANDRSLLTGRMDAANAIARGSAADRTRITR